MSDVRLDSPKGVLRRGWSESVGDYAIAGGWTLHGQALVVGDAAGGVYAFDGKSGASAWKRQEAHDGGVLAMAIHPRRNRVRYRWPGRTSPCLGCRRGSGNDRLSTSAAIGWRTWRGHRTANGWRPPAPGRFATYGADGGEVWRSDDHPSTVSAIAWSSTGELATACYGRVTFFDACTGERSPEAGVEGLPGVDGTEPGRGNRCLRQPGQLGALLASLHGAGRHDVRISTANRRLWPSMTRATLLATGGGDDVTVWSFQGEGPEGTRPGVLELHVEPVTTLAFARRGMRLASAARDGAVVVWSLQKDGQGRPIGAAILADIGAELYWRPDGRALAALDARGGVTVWRIG